MKYNENDYKKKCEELSLQYIGFHKEKHKGTIIEYICPKHIDKEIQNSDWSHFKNYSIGCKYCTGRGKTNDDIQKEVEPLHVKIKSKYIGCEKPINCECMICGYSWITMPKVLTSNKSACPKCGREKANQNEMKSQEKFISELNEVNPFIKIIGEYIGTHKWIKCKCLNCNKDFYGMPSRLLRKEAGCPFCNLSLGELTMLQTLDFLGVSYERQYSFKDCKYINVLKFDAYDVNNNIAFEYNGEQHYYPIENIYSDYDSQKEYELIQKRDLIKQDYCKRNKIPLIIIPYWEKDNMENYLKNEFQRRNIYC